MSQKDVTFLQFSDTHLFESEGGTLCGQNTLDSLKAILSHAQEADWPPDFILVTGDLSQDQSKKSYQLFKSQFETLNVPVICCPGNHDDPALMKNFLKEGPVQVQRHYARDGWQFLLLDSTIPKSNDGALSNDELKFLDETLASHKDPALLVFHHSPILLESQWMDKMVIKNADDFFSVVDRHSHVKAILWGHIHQEYQGKRNGVQLFGTPSTSVQFKPQSDHFGFDKKGPGYRWLRLTKNGKIETKIVRKDDFSVSVDLNATGY